MTSLRIQNNSAAEIEKPERDKSAWSDKYGIKHRWQRIAEFPVGISAPKRVRIYQRTGHYILQWWDRTAGRNLSRRVDGDLVAAIMAAREIEQRLEHFGGSGQGCRITHPAIVEQFKDDLHRRADAGEIDPGTVARYESALGYYERFTQQPSIETAYPSATQVNREFAQKLAAYLEGVKISPNGHPHAKKRGMQSVSYVLDVVRALFAWAADPERGDLMPAGFRNPFVGKNRRTQTVAPDLFGEPDVTVEMAARFLATCDAFQLPLFALISLYGLRPSEACFLFREHLMDRWLKVACDPALAYVTKGRRDKRLPLLDSLGPLLSSVPPTAQNGPLFLRRPVLDGRESPALVGWSLDELRREFDRRCRERDSTSARDRLQMRDELLREAGALRYDQVEHEFHKISRALNWPSPATLKDFRHLFSTSLENAGMPLFYRRYLMGQAPGNSAIVPYTHLNQLREQYEEAAHRQLQPLIDVVVRRWRELETPSTVKGEAASAASEGESGQRKR